MRRIVTILALILITVSVIANSKNTYSNKTLLSHNLPAKNVEADSIMRIVISSAAGYEDAVSKYDAEIYIKGHTEILKHNFLIRFANHLFPVDRKNKDIVFEMVSQSKFNAPNTYLHNFKAVNGNSIPNSSKQQEVLNYLNLNVYSPTAYNEGILMPVASNAFSLYNFTLEGIQDTAGLKIYKIRFMPKIWSQKLVCGDLYIIDKSWIIDKIDMNGRLSFAEFNLVMTFSRDFRRFILPEKADLFLRYHVLGNAIVSTYHSTFKYNEVEWVEEDNEKGKGKSLDLTSYYRLSSDTVPIIQDSAYWNKIRDIPLTAEEQKILYTPLETSEAKTDTTNMTKYIELTEQLTNTVNLDYRTTRIKYSGLLNPFQLGYSARNGISYKQKLRLSKTFKDDRQLRFRPEIGFVSKRKEIFFKVAGDWEYKPEKMGVLSLTIANGNQGYSSEITQKINKELKDSIFDFDDLNLKYFKHYYVDLRNSFELFNGFQLMTGISYHRRIPVKSKTNIEAGDDVNELLNENFHDFLTSVGFTYTPRQYYRMDGHRKEYVRSYYPTISLEIAQAIPNVGKSTGNYGRVEADIHQSISLGLLRKLNYHISGGFYTRAKSTYFADFEYFTRHNFPDSWNDKIGGVFNLLKSEWYNASDKYVQAHFMYQSPFILFQLLENKEASKHIFSERFYLSQLWTPILPSYTEVGYGLGNNIFNIGIFLGFDRWEYQSVGFKFAFELFQ
ncbi:DUF5686 family protein [Parabacteroides bouchesdurhonensis]|uniref:DUF5686 family protein n=1 Tax=Parabacteroides bouchesdurhonensis TaxID=1936995 RepID=UPI000E4F661D|nr:DUF5686 family protein [Parabacteroides bouchesdurhonensis]RHJ92532.1 hypothetical protein DW095_07760 [Bacteroides sp. AM07-16]